MIAAFFDIDGTLIAGNSAPLYMQHLRESGQVGRVDMARAFYHLMRYRFGLLDVEGAMAGPLTWLRGRSEAAVRADCEAWYARTIRPQLLPAPAGRGSSREDQRPGR